MDMPVDPALRDAMTLPDPGAVRLPFPQVPQQRLPTGAMLRPAVDFTRGVPTEAQMAFGLVAQLMPVLALLDPLMKIFEVAKAVQQVLTNVTDPGKVFGAVGEVVKAIDGLKDYFTVPLGTGAKNFSADLLVNLGLLLQALGAALEEAGRVAAGIEAQLRRAEQAGNAELAAALTAARDNAITAARGSLLFLNPIAPLLAAAGMFLQAAKVTPPALPGLADPHDAAALADAGTALRDIGRAMVTVGRGLGV